MKDFVTRKLQGKEFLGHPSGLFVLFFTEMWERFSYYGMRALLVLYMVNYQLEPSRATNILGYGFLESILSSIFGKMTMQQMSSQIYGLYTGFVFFAMLPGGILADRVLGQYKTVYIGGVLMAIGHFLMASEKMFLVALLFLIIGNGCFKPNISTQVGNLYKPGDPRKDRAFTLFYMGINLGAFISPLVCGTLGQLLGWHWGFGAAGVGMVTGLLIYWAGSGLVPHGSAIKTTVQKNNAVPLTKKDWIAILALFYTFFLAIMYWAIYEQQGNTMQLWADQRTNWNVLGINIPSAWFQSFNPAMIFILAPLLNIFWNWQNKRGKEPSSIYKMGIGTLLTGSSFIIMFIAARMFPEPQRSSILWLISTTFVYTIGELYLSPISLSFVSKVAPKKIISTMMGAYFLSSFFGNYMTGYIGTYYDRMSKENFFLLLTAIGVITGILFLLSKRPLEKIFEKNI